MIFRRVILFFISLFCFFDNSHQTNNNHDVYNIANEIRRNIKGYVFLRGSPEYENARAVHNGACRNIFPLLIVKPLNSEDVSVIVNVAVKYGIELSVRSGGHSFQCQGTKPNSIHIDLRAMNSVQFYPPYQSVRIGAGALWKHVLNIVDPKMHTVIHGNAKNVGVGGFFLGVGANPLGTSHRHGFGADTVIEYKLVLADGSIAIVSDFNTTIISRNGKSLYEVYEHTEESNLKYGLRSGGGSFGIVTEFLVKVFPHKETKSFVAFTFIKNSYDIKNLIKAGQDGKYAINILQPLFFRRPLASKLLAWATIKFPQFIRWQSGQPYLPILVSIVDINSNSGITSAGPAIKFLKSYGLDVANDNSNLNERFGLDNLDLTVDDQDSFYLTKDELQAEGYHAMVSANGNGLYSYKPLEDIFLHDQVFGTLNRKISKSGQNTACDFCLWILSINKPGVNDNIIADTEIGPMSYEMSCTYNSNDPFKSKNCPLLVKNVQNQIYSNSLQYGETPRQYVNTPGCNDRIFPFYERYWGNSYPRLLKIKKFWDPENVFNYCQSIGSTNEQCCIH